jgi:uncharacterized membrane protein YccC
MPARRLLPMNPVRRLPAFVLNGIAVAVGVGLIQLVISALAGSLAAQLALSGSVCASLGDVPNTVTRTFHRVSAAALLGAIAALVVALLRPHPVALGVGVGLIAFGAMMAMAWGARAGPVSFAPILSLVFSMAVPPTGQPLWELAAWNAVGGIAYLLWSLPTTLLLQGRYRVLALSQTLLAAAELLRARALVFESPPSDQADATAMQAWIKGEAALAERLQTARDFVFAEPDTDRARRDTAILLRAIDLRDVLLASRLDLELLGRDRAGQAVLRQVAEGLRRVADALDAAALALREGTRPAPLPEGAFDFRDLFDDLPIPPEDPRTRLLPVVVRRLRSVSADVIRIHALLHGEREESPLTRADLQRFVAPEGWPLKALRAQLSWHSPVLRHALRTGLALASAYFIALLLPWASHPHWLVLSVAVVLRGNLEQTLTRRNARVLGTMFGCLVVVVLSITRSLAWLDLFFLVAVGAAHSFVNQRYWITATAGTVMALLQSHMIDPGAPLAIGERMADTVLGALLAWGFSYVLPSWERRSLPNAIARLLKELREYAAHAMSPQAAGAVEQRLARRRAYDALSALATALQRSAAEPKAVRVPLKEVAALLDHGQRLMAHLSMVRMMLSRGSAELRGGPAEQALAEARQALDASLDLATSGAAPVDAASTEELVLLPMQAPAQDAVPWLLRRLQLLAQDARRIREAAASALARVRAAP